MHKIMSVFSSFRQGAWLVAVLLAVALAGCQPRVYLMPTPAALRTGEIDPFAGNPLLEKTNRVQVVYATNRLPVGLPNARAYTILPSDILHLGVATLRIGREGSTWEELHKLSTSAKEAERPEIELENLREVIRLGEDDDIDRLTPEAQAAFDRLNAVLAQARDKDVMVYVHGANNNVYRATAQAAQYHHFTGRNSVVVTFAWPSAESLLRYATDVENARLSLPAFARFIELLARHTKAKNINILAYSAGAQVVSPGLALVAERAAGETREAARKRLRLGEVYYAAPDVDFKAFVEHLPRYIDLVRNVTLSVNMNDTVLELAAQAHYGASRAGRPDPDELTPEQTRWVIEASNRPHFDVISVEPSDIPQLARGEHAFWYDNPWVSSDVLIQFLFHARPAQRGLTENREKGFVWWTFPTDYDKRVIEVVRKLP
jgi:esterase/lipase superfamily enzyme